MTSDGDAPYHLVQVKPWSGQHIGPFTTYTDALLAREIGSASWINAQVMSNMEFRAHLKAKPKEKAHDVQTS